MRKSIKLGMAFFALLLCIQVSGSRGYSFFEETENQMRYTIEFIIYGVDGNPINMKKTSIGMEGKLCDFQSNNPEMEMRGVLYGRLIAGKASEESFTVKYDEEEDLKYTFSADLGDYMFVKNGVLKKNQIQKETKDGTVPYVVKIYVKGLDKVIIKSTVDGTTLKEPTVMLSPKNGFKNWVPGENTCAVGKFNPKTYSKVAYLSKGEYMPTFTGIRNDSFYLYNGHGLKVIKNNQLYASHLKSLNFKKRSFEVEKDLSGKDYYSVYATTSDGVYSHSKEWGTKKRDFYTKLQDEIEFLVCLSESEMDYDGSSINVPLSKSIKMTDDYYIKAIKSIALSDADYLLDFIATDLNGNPHVRVDSSGYNDYIFTGLDLASKEISFEPDSGYFKLLYPEKMDFSKTYTFEISRSDLSHLHGNAIFKLKFIGRKPVFTFVGVNKLK